MSDEWIVIPNWERHQHYSDRSPPWVKLYLELAHKDEWNDLSLTARGLLTTLWIEFAASGGRVKARSLPSVCRQKVLRKTLDSLVEAGFVALSASKPSRARAGARPEEKRREEKNALARANAEDARSSAPEKNPDPPRANADAYKLYNPEEPDADPDALARLLELQARIGRDLPS